MTVNKKMRSPSGPSKLASVGLLGMGAVGSNVLQIFLDNSSHKGLDLKWVASSRFLFKRSDGKNLSAKNIRWLLRSRKIPDSRPEDVLQVLPFDNVGEEIRVLKQEIEPQSNWIVIDSTYVREGDSYDITSNLLGRVNALISANKTAWANRKFCERLYLQAAKENTLLGLNCTVGVWNDQLDYVPLFLSVLDEGEGLVTKRDNSSLNLFFAKIEDGLSPERALADVAAGGYLEPGATSLQPEVRDQVIKLRILVNLSHMISGFDIETSDEKLRDLSSTLEKRAYPSELASWHLAGRSKGYYPALVSSLEIDGKRRKIEADATFVDLHKYHELAKNFRGRNVVSTRIMGKGNFVHAGYGGASKTALKLVKEAEWTSKLSAIKGSEDFDPIPVLMGLKVGDTEARRKNLAFASKLSQTNESHG